MKFTGWLAFVAIKAIPQILFWLIAGTLYYIPKAFFRCLPVCIKAPVRQSRRLVVKTGLGAEQHAEMKMVDLVTNVKNKQAIKRRFQGGEGHNSPLAEFLGIYDMLLLVTPHLHYTEVMNLSRVSKNVREAVLPVHDFDRRRKVFSMYSCVEDSKTGCWVCGNQICDVSECVRLLQTKL